MTNDYHAHLTDDVRRALEEADEAYRLAHPEVETHRRWYTRDELADLPEQVPLIKGLIPRHGVTMVSGKRGLGKSLVALDWAGCIGTDKIEKWHGFEVAAKGPVLYSSHEGFYGFPARVEAWEAHRGARMTNVEWSPDPVNLRHADQVDHFIADVRQKGAIAVVVDSARSHGSGNEGADDMTAFVAGLEALRIETDVAVIVLHNAGWDETRERGHTSLPDACDATLHIEGDAKGLRALYHRKMRDGRPIEEHDPVTLRFRPFGAFSGTLDPIIVAVSNRDKLLAAVRANPGQTTGAVAADAGVNESSASSLLNAMMLEDPPKVINTGTRRKAEWRLWTPDSTLV